MIVTQNNPQTSTVKPEFINQNHWNEWIKSGVKPSVIAANVYTEIDPRKLDEVLNRNNKRRRKHSDKLVPAWVVRGIDPSTQEVTLLGVQAKPDNPEFKNGKNQKYIGASEYGAAPLFLRVDNSIYWLKILQDLSIPIIITEGAKKAACLLSNEYAAISIPGVSTCRKNGRLHQLIEQFCGFGRTFYLAFDNDIITKRPVQLALTNLARDLSATGSKVKVISLPEGDAKGVDDYIVANSVEAFDRLIIQSQTIEEWKEQNDFDWAARQEQIKNKKRSKLARAVEAIQQAWGGFLKWNELTQSPELSNEELLIDELKVKIALELDMDVQKEDSVTSIKYLSRQHSYHPIKEYLQDVAESYKDVDLSIIDKLSSELFGNSSPICDIYMRRFLIGAVARIMKPGTKMDNAVILHGAEGIKKSTFWSSLFGEDWFSDSMDDSNVKDEKMLIHQYWCLEWSEFSTVYKRKDIEALKKFLAQREDSFRRPYDRGISKHKRSCVFVGTTNSPEVLQDATGRNRRFWVINVNQEIDIAKLEKMRDRIWAAAYHCWQRGDIHYIPEKSHEAMLQDKENEQFKVSHPWQELIYSFLLGKQQTYLAEIFDFLQIEPGRREARHERLIRDCLKVLGWEATEERGAINGTRPRLWKKNQIKNDYLGGQVGQDCHNLDSEEVSACPPNVPPAHPSKTGGTDLLEINPVPLHPTTCPTTPQVGQVVGSPKEPSDTGSDSPIPPAHLNNQNQIKNNSGNKTDDPLKKLPEPKTYELQGIVHKWKCDFIPKRKCKKHTQVEFIYTFPDGDTISHQEKITGGVSEMEVIAHRNMQIFECEAMKVNDITCTVLDVMSDKWITGCTLTGLPKPPVATFYYFKSPDGKMLKVAGEDEFKVVRANET
ncbi:MAG: VapE domain-containing protein [Cyanobacteria bacterium P01_A01_bin.80]